LILELDADRKAGKLIESLATGCRRSVPTVPAFRKGTSMMMAKKIYNGGSELLKHLENWFIGIAILAIALFYTFTIVNRFLFAHPFHGLEEMTLFIAIAIVFIGASVCTRDENHICIVILPLLTENRIIMNLLKVLGNFGSLIFVVVFALKSWEIAADAFEHKEMATTVEMPLYIPYMLPVIGMGLVALHYIPHIIRDISLLMNTINNAENRG